MTQTQQPQQGVAEKPSEPMDASHTAWPLPAIHRRPAVVVLMVFLIVLQLVLAGIVVVHARRLMDLGERIERLERK